MNFKLWLESSQNEFYIYVDLDETLCHTQIHPTKQGRAIVLPRPGYDYFLSSLKNLGPLYMLSAGSQSYIESVADHLEIREIFDGIFSVRNGPLPPRPPNDWVLIDDREPIDPRKLHVLGDVFDSSLLDHIIHIKPFLGETEDDGEFRRVLKEVRNRIQLSILAGFRKAKSEI